MNMMMKYGLYSGFVIDPMDIKYLAVWMIVAAIMIKIIIKLVQNKIHRRQQLKAQLKKGKEGEMVTARYLNKIRGYKKVICNLYIPTGTERRTVEIDMVMLHEKGIFVIENKNYSGWIFGSEEEEQWLQVLGKGKKNYFYSPIRQNQSHIRNLKRMLRDSLPADVPFLSVITFNHQARLRRIYIRTDDVIVTYSKRVKRKIRKRLCFRRRVLERRQIDQLYQLLKERGSSTRKIRKEHGKQVKRVSAGRFPWK